MINYKNIPIILLSLSLLFFQCKEKHISLPSDLDCIPHDRLQESSGEFLFSPYHYPISGVAHFNPNNPDEFICRYIDGIQLIPRIIKYNLNTKEKTVVFNSSYRGRPKWGKNDWILLNIQDDLGFNIYKIRSSGEDLTRLTTNGVSFTPEWNITGDKFICELGLTSPTQYLLIDSVGIVLDTLFSGTIYGSSWRHDSLVATASYRGLTISNPLMPAYQRFELEAEQGSYGGAEWLDEENVFWCHTSGIYVTNIITEETTTIRETCNALCYQEPTYAPARNKIIVERLERIERPTEEVGELKRTLVMMNPDGTEEEEIQIEL